MNPDLLLPGVLGSLLGGGRKRSGRARRYLTGDSGSIWTRPTTLLTAAGVAWGIYETLQRQGSSGSAPATTAAGPPMGSLPPLPVAGATAPASDAERVVQLAISAANADGVMSEKERAVVLQQAKASGVGDVVEREFQQRRPLAEIVGGVTDPAHRATLYILAYTVLRADEQVTGAERIYLARLADLLGLEPDTVQRLEKDAGERIDALGDQGQLGG